MRILRFLDEHSTPTFGVDHADGTATELIDHNGLLDAAVLADPALATADAIDLQPTDRRCEVVRLLVPLIPVDVVCIGRNYVREGDDPDAIRNAELEVFLKPRSAIIGPGNAIQVPNIAGVEADAHAEGELVIVIARRMRNVPPERTLEHVLGFTLANDVTARHWATPTGSPLWMRGKGFDTFCPLGPAIATRDEFISLHDTRIETRMNGTLAMSSPLSQMARSVEHALAQLSSRLTLHPGTIVLTGGPPLLAGLPANITLLKPGDRTNISAAPIGTLTNTVT
jgi:2-keto-4-pentenoate hydratase/2-oxohepta-3-ene-1,7-dioic acid hydratase in catechol pathway